MATNTRSATKRSQRYTQHDEYSSAEASMRVDVSSTESSVAVPLADVADESGEQRPASQGARPQSSFEPVLRSRQGERNALVGLNNRLAQYIERVRHLEKENSLLEYRIREVEEVEKRDITHMQQAYEKELEDVRRALDAANKEKAKLAYELNNANERADKANAKCNDAVLELGRVQKALQRAEERLAKLEPDNKRLQRERDDAVASVKKQSESSSALHVQMSAMSQQVDEANLRAGNAETEMASLKEQVDFERRMRRQDAADYKRRRSVEAKAQMQQVEKTKQDLRAELEFSRAEFANANQRARQDMDDMWQMKLRSLQDYGDQNRESADRMRDEAAECRVQLDRVNGDLDATNAELDATRNRLTKLEHDLNNVHEYYAAQLKEKEDELAELHRRETRGIEAYHELLDLKNSLQAEIDAYNGLLAGEEKRLNLSTEGAMQAVPVSSRKRRRMATDFTASPGGLQPEYQVTAKRFTSESHSTTAGLCVEEQDTSGAFVRLCNESQCDMALGGYHVRKTAEGNDEEIGYKLPPRASIAAGATLTIWSSDANATHSPPTDYVMKEKRWPVGDKQRSWLEDADGKEIAWRMSTVTCVQHATGTPAEIYSRRYEDIDDDQRCVLM